MSKEEFDKLLDRYSKNECSPEERKFIDQWYDHASHSNWDLEENQLDDIEDKLWRRIGNIQVAPGPVVKQLPTRKRQYSYKAVAGLAASFLLVALSMSLFIKYGQPSNDETSFDESVRNARSIRPGEPMVIRNDDSNTIKPVSLSDGSIVVLQPRSEIRYDGTFNAVQREVTLVGEAFFQIARDPERPFMVHSGNLVTKVLGTSFNIKAREGDKSIVVDVKTGKVDVFKREEMKSENIYHLTPNQQAVYDRSSGNITHKLQDDPHVIITDEEVDAMRFDEAPATDVFAAIEKAYGVKLEFDRQNFSECYLTTHISHESLHTKLQIICAALGATYEVEGTEIIIRGSGCNGN